VPGRGENYRHRETIGQGTLPAHRGATLVRTWLLQPPLEWILVEVLSIYGVDAAKSRGGWHHASAGRPMWSAIAGCNQRVAGRNSPRSGGIVGCPSSQCSRAETAAPGGRLPWTTCRSCWGPPGSTRFREAVATATGSARAYWPASSMTTMSSFRSHSFRLNSYAVPATRRAPFLNTHQASAFPAPPSAPAGLPAVPGGPIGLQRGAVAPRAPHCQEQLADHLMAPGRNSGGFAAT
jgi:hypothetical protein